MKRFLSGGLAGLYLTTALLPGVVAQSDVNGSILEAPTRATVFVTDPSQKPDEPESTKTIYYSQKKLEFDAQAALVTIKKLSDGIDEVLEQVDKLDEEFGKNNRQYQQTRKEIFEVVSNLDAAKESLSKSVKKIRYYQQQMVESAAKIDEIRAQIDETKEYIERFTTFLYKFHNDIYGDDGDIDEIKLFLKTESHIGDQLSNSYLVESMIVKLEELMGVLKEEEKKQVKIVRKSNEYKRSAQDTIEMYQQSIDDLNQKRLYLLDFLALYRENSEKIEGSIKSLFDTRLEAHNVITDTIAEIKEGEYNASFNVPKKLNELKNMKDYSQLEHPAPFDWPLYPIDDIEYFFMDKDYKEEYGIDLPGIEIGSTERTPVYAPKAGVVYKIANKDGVGFNWMLIMHEDGYVTVFKFLKENFLKEGDLVRRGELIGYAGGKPWESGAGFVSKGPNLTFMVAQHGEYIDPLSVMDLSVVRNRSMLPKTYKIEALRSLYNRPRDLYQVSFMEGRTLDDRFEEFLDTYAVGIYRDPLFWEDAAEGSNIPAHLGACIGFAETSFTNFATKDNIGNVGNNDRGDRIAYSSPLEGARLIFQTLNNIHLGHYDTIAQLNGYANREGKNYATSQYNWQNNVIKCMSMVEGYHVPDNFPFRTGPNPRLLAQESKES